jgi:hypothetical protein
MGNTILFTIESVHKYNRILAGIALALTAQKTAQICPKQTNCAGNRKVISRNGQKEKKKLSKSYIGF